MSPEVVRLAHFTSGGQNPYILRHKQQKSERKFTSTPIQCVFNIVVKFEDDILMLWSMIVDEVVWVLKRRRIVLGGG